MARVVGIGHQNFEQLIQADGIRYPDGAGEGHADWMKEKMEQ